MPDTLFLLAVHVEVWKSGEDEVHEASQQGPVCFLSSLFFNLVVDW